MKHRLFISGAVSFLFFPGGLFAASLSVSPENPIQGDPLMISIQGTTTLADIESVSFGGKSLGMFVYQNQPSVFYGMDINKKPGTYEVVVRLKDGTTLEKSVTIGERKKMEVPFTIPQKLGGNTPASQKNLVDTLAVENASFLGLRTGTHAFWTGAFAYPVSNPIVTDPYGYSRATGAYTVTHKGADFRAAEGTKVLAMNRGVVRVVREYRNYGKTIIVDHGLGLMTFYMHLSKILVNAGELVLPGQVIGLSGQTGYAEQPHLHLTVRLSDISIDPVRFLGLFK